MAYAERERSEMEELAVEAVDLRKAYDGRPVLDGVSLRVPRGSVLALLGANGAGKTTTVRILATLLAPDGGTARVAGHDVVAERHAVRRAIALTGQHAAVDDLQTGTENLRMTGRLRGLSLRASRARALQLLERFGLAEASGRRVGTYSGGMRRRLDLAASLVVEPEVLVLDEPTTGLDPRSRRTLWDAVAELVRDGVAVLLTTQDLEEADRLADRVAVLDGGRIVADDSPAELKQRVADHRLELVAADEHAHAALRAAAGDRVVAADAAQLRVDLATDGAAADVRAVLDALDPSAELVRRFRVRMATLDDVFLTLTREEAARA